MSHALNLYLASDPTGRHEPRLFVARDAEQVVPKVAIGMKVRVATRFEAYRMGKCQVQLEYITPKYEGVK